MIPRERAFSDAHEKTGADRATEDAPEGWRGTQSDILDAEFRSLESCLPNLSSEALAALHRLRVLCGEQAAALDELAVQGEALNEEIQDLGDLIWALPIPILKLDHKAQVQGWNRAARALFPVKESESRAAVLARVLSRTQMAELLGRIQGMPAIVRPEEGGPDDGPAPQILILAAENGAMLRLRVHLVPESPGTGLLSRLWWMMLTPEATPDPRVPDLVRFLLDSNSDEISVTDASGRVFVANRAFAQKRRRSLSEIEGRHRDQFMSALDALHNEQLDAQVRATRASVSVDQRLDVAVDTTRGLPAAERWARVRTEKRPLFNDMGEMVGVVTQSRDITEDLRVREAERLADKVFEQSSDAIALTDPDLRILRVNPAFELIAGFVFAQLRGHSLESMIALESGGGPPDPDMEPGQSPVRALLQTHGNWSGEVMVRRSDGLTVACWTRIGRLRDSAGRELGFVAMFSDLTLLRQAQADNERLAYYDQLTGLPNRRFVIERISERIGLSKRSGERFTLLFVDLDQFKSVNDSLGHETGDLLLMSVANRLRLEFAGQDFAARIGGDEFIILLGDADAEAAETRALALLEQLAHPIDLPGLRQYRPAATIGIACYGSHGDTRDALLRNADLAMYSAKMSKRPVMVYEPRMGKEASRELDLRNALVGAAERDELVLHFQPLFDLRDRSINGCEALLRWNRPGHELILPGVFLPIAARAGLMPELDRWVLDKAVGVLARWRAAGLLRDDWVLSVNQNARSLAVPEWCAALETSLARAGRLAGLEGGTTAAGAPWPQGLQIELTEDILADGATGSIATLHRMRAMGVALGIDDFGTGYSSLAYLSRLPATMLKIDASFVRDIDRGGNARMIVEAIVGLAKKFGFTTLAEGIETDAEAAALAEMGCDSGQGFVLSPPVGQEEFETRFLRR
ncbi:EAL domain-containing protein [Phaeovulum vinaykumarii]|uniref:PAS domain S-box-containing protein/diguanylate cyclase (GGDEF) domain-containing protein n=1 Tax=Phaeovulum vinaykumarii TaxID=407234 RepID=A0A1N7M862_9RHOB|nr:EAL domain-containing protein [Phaeovulum vinaykumarii]SIS82179.1 PAS domain S-box-containing protein/diguanylate cyclase (GGDEF) domain-containing protein [Phaeovulum vinaykumarii]SOC11150.1 PAS domain S-box-containing protein/diguanylate cyclase (GGDEF)-like protein [Phaeovulum vinaykumarii]